MNILMLGPQGSGKGTQARLLSKKFGFFYFESGAFLRDLAKTNEVVRNIIDFGKLVADREMSSYIQAFFDAKGSYDNIIFDGFPRTSGQYEFFRKWLTDKGVKLDLAFVLKIRPEETVRRLSARRQDPATGKIYNLITDLPPAGVDEKKLIQREDDKPEAIEKRLQIYNELTVPLIAKLKEDGRVVEVDGERPIEEIQKDLANVVEKEKK